MASSTLALILLAALLVIYITNVIHPVIATLIAALIMTFTNIITPSQALSGFGGTTTVLVIGMGILGAAFFTTGLSSAIGGFLASKGASNERMFILLCSVIGFCLGMVVAPMAVIAVLVPIIDSVASQSGGKVQRKYVYLPVSIACIYGGTMTAVSSSGMITAGNLLNEASGQSISFFQPAMMLGLGAIAMFILMPTVGYAVMKKVFTFEEPALPAPTANSAASTDQLDKKKALILVGVLIFAIIGFAFTDLNIGVVALTSATILMLTNCISLPVALSKVSWTTVFLLASGTAFSAGLQSSGAADILAGYFIRLAGEDHFLLCCAVFILASLLSQFMANTNAVLIVAPIALSVGQSVGADLLPFAIAVGVGAGTSVCTVLANVCVAFVTSVGYRFKDIISYGAIVNAAVLVLGCLSLRLFFF